MRLRRPGKDRRRGLSRSRLFHNLLVFIALPYFVLDDLKARKWLFFRGNTRFPGDLCCVAAT
jgi:hypothetical protein